MNILITGGAGFVGSHLAEMHIARGDRVAVIDDLSTGAIENLAALRGQARFSYVIETIEHRQTSAELVDSADLIYHLAAAVGVRLIVESPVRTIETNVRGTEIILSLAAKKRKTVVITSTSEVYGKRTNVPFRETDDLILGPTDKGRWSYACSKALDEFLALAYWKEKGVPARVARLFNTVGPRQTGRYGMVVPNFVRQALTGQDITVFGDGRQQRCFLHVSDAIAGLADIAVNPGAEGDVFNIGSTEELSILELAQRIKRRTGSASQIRLVPYNEAYEAGFEDMFRRVPDCSKITALTGWRPRRDLETILNDVIEYESERLPHRAAAAHV